MLKKLATAADNTFRKDRRINIRLSEHDMVGIQRVAASKGVPYQTLISGLIHQFVEGDLIEKA
jgi:predicted DNA binding CopG/RHH family protein